MYSYAKISKSLDWQKTGWYYLDVDDDLSKYLDWFRSKYFPSWQLPMNGCHITFVSVEWESKLISEENIEPYMDEDIGFFYDNPIMTDGRSFWIDTNSPRLDEIRKELGLDPKWRGFHITLGNWKNNRYMGGGLLG